MQKFDQERVERVARIYKTNQDAADALGIAMRSFSRICRRFGVETPYLRMQRLKKRGKKNLRLYMDSGEVTKF